MSKRTILIVEDEATISFNLKIYCSMAKNELISKGIDWAKDVEVVVAETLERARQVLETEDVIFISLDLNLNDGNQGRALSGMVLLRELREREHDQERKTMVIVVSGQGEISNATEALMKLKSLGYFVKSELQRDQYIKTIQAGFQYQNAVDLLAAFEKRPAPKMLYAAEESAKAAQQIAEEANLSYGNFSESLEARILTLRERLDKVTHLPLNDWVKEFFRTKIVGKPKWSLMRVNITHLDALSASQINPLMVYLAGKLHKVAEEFHYDDLFVGNYLLNQKLLFIVIVEHNIHADQARVVEWLNCEFEKNLYMFANNLAADATAEKPRLEIEAWHSDTTEFWDMPELIDALGK